RVPVDHRRLDDARFRGAVFAAVVDMDEDAPVQHRGEIEDVAEGGHGEPFLDSGALGRNDLIVMAERAVMADPGLDALVLFPFGGLAVFDLAAGPPAGFRGRNAERAFEGIGLRGRGDVARQFLRLGDLDSGRFQHDSLLPTMMKNPARANLESQTRAWMEVTKGGNGQ